MSHSARLEENPLMVDPVEGGTKVDMDTRGPRLTDTRRPRLTDTMQTP